MKTNPDIKDKDFVHIWTCNINSDSVAQNKVQNLFSATELSRIRAFKEQEDKNRYIAAHLFLRSVLSKYTGTPSDNIEFFYSRHYEKPFIDHTLHINFNLSYRQDWALLAITDQEAIGIDIEKHVNIRDLDALVASFFSEKEKRWLKAGHSESDQNNRFFTLWTLKEAYMKATGEGLSMQSQSFSITTRSDQPIQLDINSGRENTKWILKEISAPDNYSAAIAIKKNIHTANIIVQNFPILELKQILMEK